MKKDYTHYQFLLDRSGSMGQILGSTIEGFNEWLFNSKMQPGEATFSLIQFDDDYNKDVWFSKIEKAPYLSEDGLHGTIAFSPRGGTALLDAMCRAIDETGDFLSRLNEDDRPSKVIFVALTDGEENASKLKTYDDVARRIKIQESRYNWTFTYLGANQDSIATAARMGIRPQAALSYGLSKNEIASTYSAMTAFTNVTRAMGDASYSPQDRSKSLNA